MVSELSNEENEVSYNEDMYQEIKQTQTHSENNKDCFYMN